MQSPVEFARYYHPENSGMSAPLEAPACIPEFRITGVSDLLPVKRYSIRQSRSEMIDWSLTLDNSTREFSNGATGRWAGKLECDPFNSDRTLKANWVEAKITVGGKTKVFPKLLIQDCSLGVNPEENVVVISGSDQSEILLEEDLFLPDVNAVVQVRQSNDVIKETLSAYGLKSRTLQKSYPISLIHRIGSPMEWIRKLLTVFQAWWYMDGDEFVTQSGGYSSRAVDWTLTDRLHLKVLSGRKSSRGEKNQAITQRVDSTAGKAIEEREDEGLGYVGPFPLDFPVTHAQAHVSVQDGVANEFAWFGADGFVKGTGPVYNGGQGPVVSLRFSIVPNMVLSTGGPVPLTFLAIKKKFKWYVDGKQQVTGPAYPPPSNYVGIYTDTANVAATYLKKNKSPIVNELIPDEATAAEHSKLWVQETLRHYQTADLSTISNPFIQLGNIVKVECFDAGFDHKFLVDSWEHSGDENEDITQLELSRPRIAE